MAFTESEKSQIRRYLGFSGGYRDRSYILESMLDVVGDNTVDAEYARELLAGIVAVDEAMANTGTSGNASTYGSIKQVDEISFHPITAESTGVTIIAGYKYGEVLIERLRALLGVDLQGHYFRGTFNRSVFFGPGI